MTEPANVLIVDRETVHECLKKTDGNRKETFKVLKSAGVKINDVKQLSKYIEEDEVLSLIWTDDFTFDADDKGVDPLAIRVPLSEEALTIARIQREEDYIAARGLEKTGLEASEIKEIVALSQFSGKSFASTMDMLHGIMTIQAFRLKVRAKWIEDEVLDSEEEVERMVVTSDGDVLKYKGPKYTEEEKVVWLQCWIDINDKLRRIAETGHNSAGVRAKVERLAGGGGGNSSGNRLKKLPENG